MLVLKGAHVEILLCCPTFIVVKVGLFLFNFTLTCLPYCTLQEDITYNHLSVRFCCGVYGQHFCTCVCSYSLSCILLV